MDNQFSKKIHVYQLAVIFSMLFALVGFSYNVWRMEVSEENNTIRTACFEMLVKLSSLEQLIYTAHFDGNIEEGSPRKGWVIVGLLVDLSALTSESVATESLALKQVWSSNWESMPTNQQSVEQKVAAIDLVRAKIKELLRSLE